MSGRRRSLAVCALALVMGGCASAPAKPDLSTRSFKPAKKPASDPFPAVPAHRFPVTRIVRPTLLFSRPGGRALVRVKSRTEFGSPEYLGVVRHRQGWLGVTSAALPNGRIAWVRTADTGGLKTVGWELRADLSERQIVVVYNGERVRTIRVGVGRPGHPTPTGRFAVTDRLKVEAAGSPYGCCVLALSGHQTHLPPGWTGGDRLAVHGTRNLGGLGYEVSLGCLRADPRDSRWLMNRISLGSPVFIRQ